MEIRWQGLGRRLHFSFEKVIEVTGVNSKIDEQTHFLMWDFDDTSLEAVTDSLKQVQDMFSLPSIVILSTGKVNGYHAYCFKRCNFLLARTILSATDKLDKNYLMLGIGRGYFTLRYSDIPGREFKPVREIVSRVPADCSYSDVSSFVKYTKRVKGKNDR